MYVSFNCYGIHTLVSLDIYEKSKNAKKWPYRHARSWAVTKWHVQGIERGS